MPRVADHSDSEESVKDNSKPLAEQNGGGDEEPEYEIEQVLDAKRGVFPDVRAHFVLSFL
jgi:hypothetical protein